MNQPINTFDAPTTDADAADGFGALETPRGCLPLTDLSVRGKILALTAHTTVRQTFHNSLDEPLEATYIFPLPDRAAVSRFRMTVGDRVIEGALKERGRARQDYAQAMQQGHRAAIAEEERSGVFTMQVGNIPPGESVEVELQLVGPLPVSHGEAEYRFPLVVAPRYTPGAALEGPSVGKGVAPDTDEVPDASRVTPPVLLPGFPNPVRLSLEVEVDPSRLGVASETFPSQMRSSLHNVVCGDGPPWTIKLQPNERLKCDFILRFPTVGASTTAALHATAADDKPATLALTLCPAQLSTAPRPRRIMFVLDRSGSMGGWKMVAARRAVARMIDSLLDDDRFGVAAFDGCIEQPPHCASGMVSGTNRNRWRAMEWVGKIEARGGTEMGPALRHAVDALADQSSDDRQAEPMIVLVTDGQVSGEDTLLQTLAERSHGRVPRVFALGIDRAVNAGFLRRLSDSGGGACELVESEDRLDEVMAAMHRQLGAPALTQLRLEPLNFDIVQDSVAPSRLPDLFADRPITVFARHLCQDQPLRMVVHAVDADGRPWRQEVAARPTDAPALLNLWGRAKVRELEDEYAAGRASDALAERIVKVSLESHVLSRFTAYVAVDSAEVVNQGGRQTEIVQPVEQPEGWATSGAASGRQRMARSASVSGQVSSFAPSIKSRNFAPGGGGAHKLLHAAADALGMLANAPRAAEPASDSTPASKSPRSRKMKPAREATSRSTDELRKVLNAFDGQTDATERRRLLERLVSLLDDCARQWASGESPAEPACERLSSAINKGRELLAAFDSGSQDVLFGGAFQAFLSQVESWVDSQSADAATKPFWK